MQLDPVADQLLQELGKDPRAATLEIGGGIALWCYVPYRLTHDLDAWWGAPDEAVRDCIQERSSLVASRLGYQLRHRQQRGYESWDLVSAGERRFAFQIAVKSSRIDEPLPSRWGYLQVESLPENFANKMCALVIRGAPRDLRDVAEVTSRGLISDAEAWSLWSRRSGSIEVDEARRQVTRHLSQLDLRRPLSSIEKPAERELARRTRERIRELVR